MRGGALLCAAAVAWLLCGGPAQAQPKRGGTAIFALGSEPAGLNRNITSNNADGMVACTIYEGLTQIVANNDVKPLLAKSWTVSPDGLVYSFLLQPARFQDGQALTSEDVRFTLLEVSAKYSSIFSAVGKTIAAIETPAPDLVVIKLSHPYGPLLRSLACNQGGGILPARKLAGTDILKNPLLTTAPLGTGPFMLREWKRGDYIRLAANPYYWQAGKPYLDELIAKVIPQDSSRTQALMAGDIDFINFFNVPTGDYAVIKANPRLRLTVGHVGPSIDFMALNVTRKPLDDRRVRQALLIALDRDFLLHTAYQGQGSVGTMPFTNRLAWAVNPEVDYRKMYPFDPARASALLDEAGFRRGADGIRFSLKLLYSTDAVNDSLVTTAVKSLWRTVGVEAVIEPVDRTTASKRMFQDYEPDASINDYTSIGDPALGLARMFVTESIGKSFGNASAYSNPAVDALFEAGATAPTQDQRAAYYRKLQAILAEELPVLTLHEVEQFNAASADLHGLEDENSLPSWRDAWLDR